MSSLDHIEHDFETRSPVDLRKHGPYVYFEHPEARVLLGSFKAGSKRYRWRDGDPCPAELRAHVEAGGVLSAHNANFERHCWRWLHNNRDWPLPKVEQFRCTAATAAAMQLPRSLEKLGDALGLEVKKDKEGARLMRKFSIPNKQGEFTEPEEDPEEFERYSVYCDIDVETEAEADSRMVPLSEDEQAVYTLSEVINDRGIRIDVESAQAALRLAEKAKVGLDRKMAEITCGAVRKCSEVAKLTAWCAEQGVEVPSLAKADLDEVLAYPDLPSHVRDALETRREAAKTSTAKIKAMLDRAGRDGRVRGTYLYHGAGTGRWTSMGVNFANMPRSRKAFEGIRQDVLFEAIRVGDPDYLRFLYGDDLGRPLHLLSDAIRGFIWAAPGHDLIQADYSNIEGSVNPWLAGEEWKLTAIQEIFDNPALPDMYLRTASQILGIPLEEMSKKHWARQAVGKPAELACFAPDTQVLTDSGAKRIVEVSENDKLWDGVEWVSHRGVVARSARRVVDVAGIGVTPDHLFLVDDQWLPGGQLASEKSTLRRALATGSASLPYSGYGPGQREASSASTFSVLAALRPTRLQSQTCDAESPLGARLARAKLLGKRATNSITGTTILSRTMPTALACSTAFRLATHAALTRTRGTTVATAGAALPCTGGEIAGLFSSTLSHLMAGMTRALSLTGSTSMDLTAPVTYGSCRASRTQETSAVSTHSPSAYANSNSKSLYFGPVYDIAHAGPRNRFTVLSDNGPLIAHNCGYQGGVSAFYTFARNGGVDFSHLGSRVRQSATPEQIEKAERRYENNFKRGQARARELPRDAWIACEIIKNGWREKNPAIAQSWRDLEAAAREAVDAPGSVTEAARVKYVSRFGFLWALLPSGRCLAYGAPRLKAQVWAKVKLEDGSWSDAEVMDRDTAERLERQGKAKIDGTTSDKVTVMGTDSTTKKWRRYALYGGLLCENNTQAVARDLLVNGMRKAEAAGYPAIAHVYDEIVAEVPRGFGDLHAFEKLICELPDWAAGLPIAAGGWRGKRYRKD